MATYTNRLDEFQSHSIHYVILAARSTEELRPFTETSSTAMATSLAAVDACKQLGQPVTVPGGTGGVFLMIDTRRFSQFTISNFDILTRMAGFTAIDSTSVNSAGQDMTFTVQDSQGISFANFLQFLMDQRLGVSFQGMALLVKVLFVGHTASGETKIVQSIGIPAIFNEIQVDLNETKGIYTCKCFPLIGMNSNARTNSSWTSIGTASTYFTGAGGNTLGAVITSFEERINEESQKRYLQFNAKTPSQGSNTASSRYGRQVQYMITLPTGWDKFAFSGPTQGGAAEINFKQLLSDEESKRAGMNAKAKTAAEQQKKAQTNSAAPAKDSFIAVDPELTITEILDVIFSQCIEVAQLGNFKKPQDKTGEIRFYKHMITVTSDDSSYTVHVDVIEYIVPNVELNKKAVGGATSAGDYDKELFEEIKEPGRGTMKVPKNFLEFDYIFSGKNIDILNLDLKIQNLNLILMQQTKLGQSELFNTADNAQKQTDGDNVPVDDRATFGLRFKDPILLPKRTGDQSTNFSALGANAQVNGGGSPQAIAQQYTRNLFDLYNGGPLKAKMTIRGNPDILERITLTSLPQHVIASTLSETTGTSNINAGVKAKYRTAFEKDLLRLTPGLEQSPGGGFKVNTVLKGPSHLTSPVYIKVNVFGPNVDFITNELIAGQNFTERLFYNSYYFVFAVHSRIDGSKFTQEFDLSPYSVYGHTSISAQGQNKSTVRDIK
jgi:hypothetical protein